MTKIMIVGGTFNHGRGIPSKIINWLSEYTNWPVINGGNLSIIESFPFYYYDVLVWMPNIDNSEAKVLENIKKINPHLLLVSSKRIVEKSYTTFDVVSRLLKSHSNLGITIEIEDEEFMFSLIDPLGNLYKRTNDVEILADTLRIRVEDLLSFSRISTVCIDSTPIEVMGLNDFIDIVQKYGDEFSKFVNAVNPERFLGNASARSIDRITRCCHGFPAARYNDQYLISRRNVDKTTMSESDFVVVNDNEDKVEYYGNAKPSVDAPIQIRLFNYYNKVNYIIHGHVYVDNAQTTSYKIPCGAVNEFDDIKHLIPDQTATNVNINLKGHGCLIMANDLDYLKEQMTHLVGRPFPEK